MTQALSALERTIQAGEALVGIDARMGAGPQVAVAPKPPLKGWHRATFREAIAGANANGGGLGEAD